MMLKRYEELDSLRGLAALTVVFSHCLLLLPVMVDYSENMLVNALKHTPLRIIWAGHEAVLFFFLLSGFVLSLPFYNANSTGYGRFMIKRVCRLYLPYIVAVLFAALMHSLISPGGIAGASNWFNKQWAQPITKETLIEHVLFLGQFNIDALNGPIWSLVHEMRISIIFPLIMWGIIRLDYKVTMLGALVMSFCGYVLNRIFEFPMTGYFITLHYTSIFVIGALLAKHKGEIVNKYKSLSRKIKFALLVAAVLLYSYVHLPVPLHFKLSNEWATTAGAVIVIITAIGSVKFSKLLQWKPIAFLGKISFSLYLYHMIVISILVHGLFGILPIWAICTLAILISILVASIAYRLVEAPTIRLGRYLAKPRINRDIQKQPAI